MLSPIKKGVMDVGLEGEMLCLLGLILKILMYDTSDDVN